MSTSQWMVVFASVIVLSGCETMKGAGQGAVKDTENTYNHVKTGAQCTAKGMQCAAENVQTGVKNAWSSVSKADQWMQENMW